MTASGGHARAPETAEWLKSQGAGAPRLAVVLGSGLAGAIEVPRPRLSASFSRIPGLRPPSVSGHPGRLTVGNLKGVDLALFEGRSHLYEGEKPYPGRVAMAAAAALGVRTVLLTSACGGLRSDLRVGDFVVVLDHLVYPLGGRALEVGRDEDPDVPGLRRSVYSQRASKILEMACLEGGARWRRGVLAFAPGPCYESPSEARLLRGAGADVVSMSAAAEARAAAREGIEAACLCCVTNLVGPGTDHSEVLEAAGRSKRSLGAVLDKFLSIAAREGWGD